MDERGFYVAVDFLYQIWDRGETNERAKLKTKTL
jgi:hypothetical protein